MDTHDSYEYDFSHRERGVALIMCIGEFSCESPRKAAVKDKEMLEETCKRLGFSVRAHMNLTAVEMEKEVKKGGFMCE